MADPAKPTRLPPHRQPWTFRELILGSKGRQLLIQVAVVLTVIGVGWALADNVHRNLAAQGIRTGFDFLTSSAGFGISQSLIEFAESDSYGRAFLVGLLNTLLVAGMGIVLATLLGFTVGISSQSKNPLLAGLCRIYVEGIRNIPLLFHIFFIYISVLKPLPDVADALSLGRLAYISNRGLQVAWLASEGPLWPIGLALVAGLVVAALIATVGRGNRVLSPIGPARWFGALAAFVLFPVLASFLTGSRISIDWPEKTQFDFMGGANLSPEFVALLLALSLYFSSYIAEIVRGGLLSVSAGQVEAARALGFSQGRVLRFVTVPLALRAILPSLTNQYLNLIKASSLGAAIGYPDLVAVFAGTALNQTGQSIEIIGITMLCYLTINLLGSLLMNTINRRLSIAQR